MEGQSENSVEEIRRLHRAINDLVSLLALPAIWSGCEPSQIIHTLLDVLLATLHLDLVYVRLKDSVSEAPAEIVRVAQSVKLTTRPQEIGKMLDDWLGPDLDTLAPLIRRPFGDGVMSIVPMRLGLHGEFGVIVAGSHRVDFPGQVERLLLSVAASEAAIGLHDARILNEQKRVAIQLDQQVAHRTKELAAANEQLKKEIAERRLAEEKLRQEERELRRSEAYLAEAQRLSQTGSFGWNVASDEHFWSDETFRIFEYDVTTRVTLQLILERIHPQDIPLVRQAMALATDGRHFDYECRLLMPSGSVKYLHVVAHGTRDQDGQMQYVGAVQDVTERRLSEEALGKVRSELAHVAGIMSLGALTASIAHEVNQPLSGIITNASTCLRMLATDPPDIEHARETARRTIRDGNRASDVVTRLRALFGKKGTATAPLDLNEATREVIALFWSELQRSQVIFRAELADDLPLVLGDRVQLQQVILNLLRNALDAMNGLDDRARELLISTELDADNHVRLSVRDTGVGLEPQGAAKLFETFYTTKSGGMGIGLSISRTIIESHHGRLWAAPNDGPGVTFSFSIPRGPDGAEGAWPLRLTGAPRPQTGQSYSSDG